MSKGNRDFHFSAIQPGPHSKIPRTEALKKYIPLDKTNPIFSFRYYDHDDPEYSAERILQCKTFHKLIDGLQKMSEQIWGDIKRAPQVFHAHEIVWTDTSRINGFKKFVKQLSGYDPWQFCPYGKFRVVGCFMDDIFHVVWFDEHHKLYPKL